MLRERIGWRRGEAAPATLKVPDFPRRESPSLFGWLWVLGRGCAGKRAALYSARANLKPLVIKGHEPGGQLSLTTLVENFPGFPEGINGPDLVENMKLQAQNFGAEVLHGSVLD